MVWSPVLTLDAQDAAGGASQLPTQASPACSCASSKIQSNIFDGRHQFFRSLSYICSLLDFDFDSLEFLSTSFCSLFNYMNFLQASAGTPIASKILLPVYGNPIASLFCCLFLNVPLI
jgi:hypothetical protein